MYSTCVQRTRNTIHKRCPGHLQHLSSRRRVVQKIASLNFCTPDNLFGVLCKKSLRLIFALRTIFLCKKTASLNFCTPDNFFVESYIAGFDGFMAILFLIITLLGEAVYVPFTRIP